MRTVEVNASKKYKVLIGEGILGNTGKYLLEVKSPCRAAIITDDKVASLYLDTVRKSLEESGFKTVDFAFPNGEASKNIDTYASILEFLADSKLSRTDIIVALGGGVVGDIAGFAAATFLRGIDFIQIPTTLLAAVDSSVGGKTAIDLDSGKNLAGAFHQPSLVICDTNTFGTLDDRQLSCGYAEVIKHGVICDKELFSRLEDGSIDLSETVERCVKIKRDIVERDEFDNGERRLLNLGHTAGHAVEKLSCYSLTHGAAVAIGMVIVSKIAERCGYASESITERLCALLEKYGLPTECGMTPDEIFSVSSSDKKVEGASITLVIPEKIGSCVLVKCPLSDYEKMLAAAV